MSPPYWDENPSSIQDVVYSLLDDDKEYEEDTVDPHNRSLMIRKRINRIEDRLFCKYGDHIAVPYIAGVRIRFQIDSGSAVTLVPKCKIEEIMKYSLEESLRVTWEDTPQITNATMMK